MKGENITIYKNISTIQKNTKANSSINVLSQLLELKIENIKLNEIVELKSILEYQFWMHKAKIKLNDGKELDSFFKFIEKDKIKESIYCYWNIFIEEFTKKEENKQSMKNIKVSITEKKKDRYKNTLFLETESEKNELGKYKTKIYLIDVSKYIEENATIIEDTYHKYKEKLLFIGLTS